MPPIVKTDPKSLPPLDRFVRWVKERHAIHLRKESGKPPPWTTDPILQRYFFTNPYRENDKVTRWFRERIRDPLKNDPAVIFATLAFRWFNFIPTGEILLRENLLRNWDAKRCVAALSDQIKVFTGAYMISSPSGMSKLEGICNRIDQVWKTRDQLEERLRGATMQEAHGALKLIDGLGGFMAYEIVCDLRYTSILDPKDRMEWCNPGPGAIRGLYRMLGIPFSKSNNSSILPVPENWTKETIKLLRCLSERSPDMPPFEMREVEHSLCEWDKYERLLWGEGRSKRLYRPESDASPPKSLPPSLRRPQIAILRALVESNADMTRDEISKVSGVDRSKIGDYAGPRPENQSEKTKERWPFPTLLDLGLVTVTRCDSDGYDNFVYRASKKSASFSQER